MHSDAEIGAGEGVSDKMNQNANFLTQRGQGDRTSFGATDQRKLKPFNTGLLGAPCARPEFLPYTGRISGLDGSSLDQDTSKNWVFSLFHC